jgi:hypothetical protein
VGTIFGAVHLERMEKNEAHALVEENLGLRPIFQLHPTDDTHTLDMHPNDQEMSKF